jgi:hypothetical protein
MGRRIGGKLSKARDTIFLFRYPNLWAQKAKRVAGNMSSDERIIPQKIMYSWDDDETQRFGEMVFYKGNFWLVLHWGAGPTSDTLRPMKIVSLSDLPIGNLPQDRFGGCAVLSTRLSRRVREDQREERDPLVMLEPPFVVKKSDMLR